MKKLLSETLTELGIAFSYPIIINDTNGNSTYYEGSDGYWNKHERDAEGNVTYYENSDGYKRGTPRSTKTCDGKVMYFDDIEYKLKAL